MDCLAFQVAGEELAVSLLAVQEVSLLGPLTRVPGAPPAVRGLLNLRGSVVPAVDVAVRLGRPLTRVSRRTALIVANAIVEGGPAVVGLVVDALSGILKTPRENVRPLPPGLFAGEPDLVAGLVDVGGRLVPLLDVDALVDPSRLEAPCPDLAPVAQPSGTVASARPRELGAERVEPEARVIAPATGMLRAQGGSSQAAGGELGAEVDPAGAAKLLEAPSGRDPPPARSASRPGAPVPHERIATRPARRPGAGSPPARASPAGPRAAPCVPAPACPRDDPARTIAPRERRGPAPWLIGSAAVGAAALLLLTASSLGGREGGARPSEIRQGGGPVLAEPTRLHRDPPGAGATARPSLPVEPPRFEAPTPPSATLAPRAVHRESVDPREPSWPHGAHVVRPGESLWSLSDRYLGNPFLWPRIFAANRGRIEDPDLISPGQRLTIPGPR